MFIRLNISVKKFYTSIRTQPIIFIQVDFPEPDGPIIETNSIAILVIQFCLLTKLERKNMQMR